MANKIGITPIQEEWGRIKIRFATEPTHKEFGDSFLRFNRMGKVYEIRIKEIVERRKRNER
jgi:hypothetical protein